LVNLVVENACSRSCRCSHLCRKIAVIDSANEQGFTDYHYRFHGISILQPKLLDGNRKIKRLITAAKFRYPASKLFFYVVELISF
jgi:MinD superfamily P-loop ATPase